MRKKRNYATAIITAFVLCAMNVSAEPRFTRSESVENQPVVSDRVIGALWQGCSAGQTGANCTVGTYMKYSWQEAWEYCDALVWGGYDDWRLPGVKELRSIVDNGVSTPAIDEMTFPKTASTDYYWTSLIPAIFTSYAWCVHFQNGFVSKISKSKTENVRCIRTVE